MNNNYNGNKHIYIKIPQSVEEIIQTLVDHGYEAYAVGGCIRDTMLGVEPGDWDITTSALPMEIKGLFRRTIDTGIKHGTVTIMIGKIGYEVTTYRIDGEYEDFRHPKSIAYTNDLKEDLKRRDFTINAMAYNHHEGLIDLFGGIQDLEDKIIRCVGDPEDRFSEDALRTLRAIRFCAQLGFTIEENTMRAISKQSDLIKFVSKERIQVELDKILISKNPEMIVAAYDTGLTSIIFPEFDAIMCTTQNSIYHKYNVGEHTLTVLKNIRADHYLRWAALLHDIGKPNTRTTDEQGKDHFYGHSNKSVEIAKKVLRDLKFDNKTIDIVSKLIEYHDYKFEKNDKSVRKIIAKIGLDLFAYFLELRYADLSAKSDFAIENNKDLLDYVSATYKDVIENNNCLTLKDLAIDGNDLIELGFSKGKKIGEILSEVLDLVIAEPHLNHRDFLIEFVTKNFT